MKRWWPLIVLGLIALAWGGKKIVTERMNGPRWNNLHPQLRSIIPVFIARCQAAGVPILFWDGWRDVTDQLGKISAGVSFVTDPLSSFHPWGLAFDAPLESGIGIPTWPDAADPRWQTIGAIGESLGLEWGGRWSQRDMAHFQLRLASPAQLKTVYDRDPLAFLRAQGIAV